MRTILGLMVHGTGSAVVGAVALQWISVSSGRARASTLAFPAGLANLAGESAGSLGLFDGPLTVVTGLSGAALAPFVWRAVCRWSHRSPRPRTAAAIIGVTYACATLVLTIATTLPIVSVVGRAPGRSVTAAFVEGLAVAVVGTPLISVAMALIVSPVLIVGGAAAGILTHAVVRCRDRRLPPE